LGVDMADQVVPFHDSAKVRSLEPLDPTEMQSELATQAIAASWPGVDDPAAGSAPAGVPTANGINASDAATAPAAHLRLRVPRNRASDRAFCCTKCIATHPSQRHSEGSTRLW